MPYLNKLLLTAMGGAIMKDGLIIGLALGMVAGAVIVGTSKKAQSMITKGKNSIKKHIQNL